MRRPGARRGAGPRAVRAAGAGRAAGAVPVRAGRRARRRRGGGAGPVLAGARARCSSPGVDTGPARAGRRTRWRCCWTRRRRSWPCAPRTAGRRGGRRSWRTRRRGSRRRSTSVEPSRSREPGLQQGGPAPIRLQQGHLAATPRTPLPSAAVPGPVARDDGGVALVVAPLLGELTTAQARLLADAGAAARRHALADGRPARSAGEHRRTGRRRARRRARTGRRRQRLRRPSGLRQGPRRRPRRRARR